MSPVRIRVIAAATAVSLAGLLGLQAYWLWRGYGDARAAFERRADLLLQTTQERLDPGDELARQIIAATNRQNADSVRLALAAIRAKIDLDLTRTQLPRAYTLALVRGAMYWADPVSRDTTGMRGVTLSRLCDSCNVRLGLLFDDVGPTTFLAQIRRFVAASLLLVLTLLAGVTLTFIGLARLRRQHELHVAFVNNLAHELRTPLFSISVAGKVLGHAAAVRNDTELSRQVTLIGRAQDRLSRHMERLLEMATLQSGRNPTVHAPLDLNDVVRQAAEDVDSVRREAGATLQLNLAENEIVVIGDREQLQQAVGNMLDNAFKYGGVPPQVVVRTKRDGTTCSVEVEDNGAGIAPQHRAEIFTPFYRLTNGARHDVKGFGLGLSHVRAVATAHRGTIAVENSASPNGALFVLTLPTRNST